MPKPILECVPNFSEGRDANLIARLVSIVRETPGVALLAHESDPDHNRTVITFAGSPEPVLQAAFEAVRFAIQAIDLTTQRGVHPRIGAADVLPLVPIQGITPEQTVALAHRLGSRIAEELALPVYFYEWAALQPERRLLENVRRGQFEALRDLALTDPARRPDLGGPDLHPTAGAIAVGARKLLLAFNVNLGTPDVAIARRIAKKIRQSSGGLPHVKALGLYLESRRQAQVSLNLTDFEVTPLHVVFRTIADLARAEGVEIAGSEIIGLMPAEALAATAADALLCENYRPQSLLEKQLLGNLLDSDL